MEGENFKTLGTIGDYEIGAKWQWKFSAGTIQTFYLKTLLCISLVLMASTCIFFGLQSSRLLDREAELHQISLTILKLQSEVQLELKEIRKLKAELSVESSTRESDEEDSPVIREKRSISKGSYNSKDTKPSKAKKNSTTDKKYHPNYNTKNAPPKVTAIHLERNVTFSVTGSNGIINRWHPQWLPSGLESFELEDHNSSLVIPSTGLYLIYAQLCYAATKDNNSYEVRVINQGAASSHSKIIAQCSAGTTILDNDITCYTSVAQILQANDRVYLQQIQKHRHLLMSMGRSFLGIVKLS
ncbi:uncharacterized protein LOC116921182 isoform X1 [Daphnia magna]|uniref:uncharacterized protein LOC116921182 isoform X1 n=1 Tax=Daphnia magna TaxID=35525 RepID=UPI0006DD65C0|nr:uncharacterized protein LOC116921182 isoform X1 [Daphnia magna]XP_032783323.1 uncharacterized protein LOC116921182 isoform X1 [Daphnia magna]XP_032783324.1 uncharacterized protein LOC116921182 isoform X1 [Daphnia magna]XP_045028315.1 uncharacterized protein LOC116921182 isoform X1 [Daphnia magna]